MSIYYGKTSSVSNFTFRSVKISASAIKKRRLLRMKKFVIAGLAVVASATSALATPLLDLSTAGTAITGELGPAITAAMPIAGTLLAVGVGWKLYKRFCK